MSESVELPASRIPPAGSERLRLARLAREAALRVAGVVGTDAGPRGMFVTVGGQERLDGVLCVASQAGGYDVTLSLICRLVALVPLSQEVQTSVRHAAAGAGISVDDVSVNVAALDEPLGR